jgi:ABC-2 type transport system ATP-binding protein
LLDEPASGLDPRARIEIRTLLKELRSTGKTILVSSHILPELADLCNKIGIIEKGKLLVNGDVQEVIRKLRKGIVLNVRVARDIEGARQTLVGHPKVAEVTPRDGMLVVRLNEETTDYTFVSALLVEKGYGLTLFKEEEINLETAFMRLTKGITA